MDFNEWTLNAIREEGTCFSWMEELRFNWIPQVKSTISKILEGYTLIIITDKDFKYFSEYVTTKINQLEKNRPFIPIYPLEALFPHYTTLKDASELDFLLDMLDISFINGYIFWYIGCGNHKLYEYIEQDKTSLIWRLNQDIEGIFSLNKSDPLIDIKLIQSFQLFEKALDAALIGDIEL
ncbi:MAG: hypothetical protein GXN91_02240 [Epsilonproteobacteria bacterium]|nr:hypothetical protein [Campylobacterota bacterium]